MKMNNYGKKNMWFIKLFCNCLWIKDQKEINKTRNGWIKDWECWGCLIHFWPKRNVNN